MSKKVYDEDKVIKFLSEKKNAHVENKVITFKLSRMNLNSSSTLGNRTQGKLDFLKKLGYTVLFINNL